MEVINLYSSTNLLIRSKTDQKNPTQNQPKQKQEKLQTNTQQTGKWNPLGKPCLSSSATVLPTLMDNHFAWFLQIYFALWERWQCFSSSLQTRKNCGQIFTTANFKAIFPWQPYLKKAWRCRTCQLAALKGAISSFKNITGCFQPYSKHYANTNHASVRLTT